MSCTSTSSVVLEAANIIIGKENVVCVEPVLAMAGGESFVISNTTESFQVWFTVDGVGVAPTPANAETLIPVALLASYTKAQAATLIKTAIESQKAFYGVIDPVTGEAVAFKDFLIGAPFAVQADVDSGFTFTSMVVGSSEDLGETAEGIEITFETTMVDINSNQRPQLLDQIIQGTSSSLSMGLQEVSKTRLETIIGSGLGDVFTPAAGTSLVGYGSSKNFASSFSNAFRLVLHPVRLAASDRSEDFSYWKCIPKAESINYSGTDKKVLSVSFSALDDDSRPSAISVCAFGDSEQYLV